MANSQIIVGLEIGTSKVCAIVGELGEGGALGIIGIGQAKSHGVRKGEIVDAARAAEDIRNAIADAEQMADVEIRNVFLGVTGGHVRGFNNRGMHPVVSVDREISPEDVEDVLKNAKAVNLPAENSVLHAVRQHFCVDDQESIPNPVGMLGAKVQVDVHVIHGSHNRLQNPVRIVKELMLGVDDVVFNGLASTLALLTPEQQELGALVIDLGGGTTEYMIYADGVPRQSGVIAVGGDHVSNDLAYGLKVPLGRAEKLKIEHGAARIDEANRGQNITFQNELGLPGRTINLDHLRQIMGARIEEILELVAQEVGESGWLDYLRAGVFLCGGGARTPEIQAVAERILGLPVYLGKTTSISGMRSALDQPEFATAIGLVRYGSLLQRKRSEQQGLVRGIRQTLGQIFRRA